MIFLGKSDNFFFGRSSVIQYFTRTIHLLFWLNPTVIYLYGSEGERSSWIDSSLPKLGRKASTRRPDKARRRLYTKIFAKQPPQQQQ